MARSRPRVKRLSLDSQILVDCVLSLPSLEVLVSDFNFERHKMLIPVYVLSETKRVLIKKYDFKDLRAKSEIDKVLMTLNAGIIKGDESDKSRAIYLLRLHSDVANFHEADALIIACLKRGRVDLCYCRDEAASEIMKREGIDVRKLPTIEHILDKKLRRLLRR